MTGRCAAKITLAGLVSLVLLSYLLMRGGLFGSLWSGITWAPRHPIVMLDRAEWDFGEVAAGPTLDATFAVHNAGGARLILRKLSASCQCASTSDSEIIVEPGNTRKLSAVLETDKLSGPMKFELRYDTNDLSRPILKLFLLADVRKR